MTKLKRYFALVLSLLLAFSLMLSGCRREEPAATDPTLPAELTYKVTVVDGLGTAYTEKLIVKLSQGGKQVAMGSINAQGSFEKVLPRGDYDVEIASTNADLECFYAEAKLTAETVEAQIVMAYVPSGFNSISAPSVLTGEHISYEAALISVGSSYIELDAEDRAYALFTPTQAGTYEISVTDDAAVLGYYGSPHFVQSNNVAETMDGNKIVMSIDAGMVGSDNAGTSVLVIGLDAKEGKDECILNIKRVGDPAWSIENMAWSNYVPKNPINDFTLDSGVELVAFDVTASTDTYKLVLNEEDGTYHLGTADGPKVYVQLGEAVYGICMKDMVGEIVYDADKVLIPTGTSPFRYQRGDSKDDYFKEDYTDMMRQVVTAADKTTGVYPLTEDLFYALPLGIENKGWCREGTVNYLFSNIENVNPEIAWMFLLCHEDGEIPVDPDPGEDPVDPNPGEDPVDPNPGEDPVDPNPGGDITPTGPIEDNKDEPIIIGSTLEFEVPVEANHLVYYDLMKVNDTILTIRNQDAYVIYNGVKYEAVNGVVTVPNLYSQYTNLPVSVQIGNKGTQDAVFTVTLSYPEGHWENPYDLTVGDFSVALKKNDDQGAYYSMAADRAGVLTLKLTNVTSNSGTVQAGITVTVTGPDDIPHQYSIVEGEVDTLSVEINEGDSVVVNVCVLPNESNKYLAATVYVTASFE